MDEHQIADRLGWFSIGVGVIELAMPRRIGRALGIDGGNRWIRLFGLREIASGAAILSQRRRAPWLWARVGGDVLDVLALAAAMRVSRKRGQVGLTLAGVAAIAVLDVIAAGQLAREEA